MSKYVNINSLPRITTVDTKDLFIVVGNDGAVYRINEETLEDNILKQLTVPSQDSELSLSEFNALSVINLSTDVVEISSSLSILANTSNTFISNVTQYDAQHLSTRISTLSNTTYNDLSISLLATEQYIKLKSLELCSYISSMNTIMNDENLKLIFNAMDNISVEVISVNIDMHNISTEIYGGTYKLLDISVSTDEYGNVISILNIYDGEDTTGKIHDISIYLNDVKDKVSSKISQETIDSLSSSIEWIIVDGHLMDITENLSVTQNEIMDFLSGVVFNNE